jgi:hypothetical protein
VQAPPACLVVHFNFLNEKWVQALPAFPPCTPNGPCAVTILHPSPIINKNFLPFPTSSFDRPDDSENRFAVSDLQTRFCLLNVEPIGYL